MGSVHEILFRKKGSAVITAPTASLSTLAREMADTQMSAAVVIGETGAIVGIVTEHEIAIAMSQVGRDTSTMLVGEFMNSKVVICSPSDSDAELLRLMIASHTSHLPVVSNGKVIGIVSVEDVVTNQMDSVRKSVDRLLQMTEASAGSAGRFTAHLRRPRHGHAHHGHVDGDGAGDMPKPHERHLHRHG